MFSLIIAVIFINNVFDETVDKEIDYSSNQVASSVLERLLPQATDIVIERFMKAFDKNLRPICSDPYASHVLQMLLLCAAQRVKVSDVKQEDEVPLEFESWILKIGHFVLNNLEEFVWDTYANHVIRTVVECLGGISSLTSGTNCKNQSTHAQTKIKIPENSRKVPTSYTTLLKEFFLRLSSWPQFPDLAYDNLTSGLLQSLLIAIKTIDEKLTKKFITKLLDDCFTYGKEEIIEEDIEDKTKKTDEPEILAVFENTAATHLLETAITVASLKSLTQIYARCFINQLAVLSKRKSSNFAVQRLLEHCSQKEEYEQMYNEIECHLEDILLSGNTGVIVSLAEGCKRHLTKQGNFQQSLMKALHCFEPSERQSQFAVLTLCLRTHEQQVDSEKLYVQLHGSLILQILLNFSKPIKVVNGVLEMNSSDLKTVLMDPKGCHVMDAFMKSTFVGEKSRDKMIKTLQGMYVALACSKHGSRSVDAVWEISSLKHKSIIMDELSAKEPILNSDQYGSILASKYALSLYKHRKEEWKDKLGKENRTKKLFADIIQKADKKT
ncbi:hypothetical protein L9F63_015265 [Diploptera punctata]|uniref:Nucleolar protein 9 n=1 Tax=Diploptera punctata TaxID=6984 RepID=A0AAD8A897_DIPPU|nr:hypothetical protein L9F63_015265 [Diploptera punctata]